MPAPFPCVRARLILQPGHLVANIIKGPANTMDISDRDLRLKRSAPPYPTPSLQQKWHKAAAVRRTASTVYGHFKFGMIVVGMHLQEDQSRDFGQISILLLSFAAYFISIT